MRVRTATDAPRSKEAQIPRCKRPPADWLVLAYLAGDNDLEGPLLDDLNEMEQAGSRPGSVEILAQVDRARGHDDSDGNWRTTRRYYVTRGSDPRRITSKLLAELGETNTGDPKVLQQFIAFGARRYPAKATALIISNHGSGFFVPPEMLSRAAAARGGSPAGARRRRGFFASTRQTLPDAIRRGIAYDDGSADCLDNRELKAVLRHAYRTLGRKVDLVGMDACLMTMLEVAYQLRDHARILVGSEELEPGDGWPQHRILGDLLVRPAMTAQDLARRIVSRYVESYKGTGQEATQSAIDLGKLDDLVGAVDCLARALIDALPDAVVEATLRGAWRRALRFFDGLYVDLYDFARILEAIINRRPIRQACTEVQRAIEGQGAKSPVIAEGHVGARMRPARGISIYLPPVSDPSAFYRDLDFARRTRWADFLEVYLRERRSRPPHRA